MSDLAYDANGEPFDPPRSTAGWRVRKLAPKGALEVVYGRNGLPLFLPLEADIEDLRGEVREVGRYRLDPVDDRKRAIPNSEASYVCVPSVDLRPDPAATSQAAVVQVEMISRLVAALLESQKQHVELVRMYVSQFPVIVDALCSVIRAAGYAGLPQRATLMVPVTPDATPPEVQHGSGIAADEKDERGEPEPTVAAGQDSWPKVLRGLLDHVGPGLERLVSGLSGLGGDSGAWVNEPAVQSPEPQPATETEVGARCADVAPGSAPQYVQSSGADAQASGADAQASEPCAQDRGGPGPDAESRCDPAPGETARRMGADARAGAARQGAAVRWSSTGYARAGHRAPRWRGRRLRGRFARGWRERLIAGELADRALCLAARHIAHRRSTWLGLEQCDERG